MQIDIDFEVYKALTALRERESHTYNDVLRELLDLGEATPAVHPESVTGRMTRMGAEFSRALSQAPTDLGFRSRDLFLPEGTQLRATYKGDRYSATINRGRWRHPDGTVFDSPSAAARAITDTNWNGLRFWEARRPGDQEFRSLEELRDAQR